MLAALYRVGIDPNQLGSPHGAAVSSFLSFSIGALIPLLPWFFGSGTAAVLASVRAGECTPDIGGSLGTREAGDAIAARISASK